MIKSSQLLLMLDIKHKIAITLQTSQDLCSNQTKNSMIAVLLRGNKVVKHLWNLNLAWHQV